MLGFTALSETPLSQSATAVFANAFLPGTLAQFSTGDLLYEAIAFHTLGSVSATGEVDIEFDAQATTSMAEAIAATTINAVLADAQASTTPTAVTASFSINTFADVDAKASIVFDAIPATITAEALGFDAKAVIPITGVSLTLNNYEFTDEDAQASITLDTLSATMSVNLADPTAVVFPYQDYADEYNRQRTLFIGKQDSNNTVHIIA
jgi:riboflavin synthase alpha subunit